MEKLNGLRCRECGRHYEAAPLHVCEFCFGPLEVDYRYDALKGVVTRESIAAGPPSMWRYKELLPIDGDVAVGHHVGFTPLIRAQNLADELGCREIWVKNDSVCHPTWSFKDRVVSVAVTKAREFGFDTVACASTGNLANSVAAHAAEGRLKSYIFIPADLEQGKVIGTLVYSPTLVAVHGTYDEVNRLCSEIADKYRWAFVNVNFRPYYSEGSKSYGFEIIEQLGWRAPEHIIVPCAGGALITKIWKGIKEFKTLGLIAGPGTTKVHAAQAAGRWPDVTLISRRRTPSTIASRHTSRSSRRSRPSTARWPTSSPRRRRRNPHAGARTDPDPAPLDHEGQRRGRGQGPHGRGPGGRPGAPVPRAEGTTRGRVRRAAALHQHLRQRGGHPVPPVEKDHAQGRRPGLDRSRHRRGRLSRCSRCRAYAFG